MDKAIGVWGQQNIKTIGTAEVEDSLLSDHRMPRDERITDKTLALRRGFLLPKDDICNIGEVEVLSIYMKFWRSCYMAR